MPTTQSGAPLSAARFRLNTETASATIAAQKRSIVFHLGIKELSLKINQDANPQTFLDVAQFACHTAFSVDLLNEDGSVALTLSLVNPTLITHDFPLEFTPEHDAFHSFRFSYDDVTARAPSVPVAPVVVPPVAPPVTTDTPVAEPTSTTDTPDIPDVLELEVPTLPLEGAQESRFTPDNPDSDGDGVPDSVDKAPKDPKKH